MSHRKHHRKLDIKVLFWLTLLTFTAGYTNALGLVFLSLPLTHYTGNITNLAVSLINKGSFGSLRIILAIISFFIGGMLSGIIFYKKHVGFSKKFGFAGICSGVMYIAVNFLIRNVYMVIISTAFISGLQNGLLTRYKGMTTRTTHMTGYITDASVYLGRAISGDKDALTKFKFLVFNIFSFFLGTVIGVFSIDNLRLTAFIITGTLKIITGIYYLIFINKKDIHQVILKNE